MSVIRMLELACKSKACAPPPVGSGGSTPGVTSPSAGESVESQWTYSFRARELATESSKVGGPTPLGETAAAVNSYIGSGYRAVNHFLRTGQTSASYWQEDADAMKLKIKMIDHGFKLFGVTLEQPTTVHRGMSFEGLTMEDAQGMFRKGSVITDEAYGSTTMVKDKIVPFSRHEYYTNPVRGSTPIGVGIAMRILLPSGTRVMAGHYGEHEMILPRGTKYRVVGTRRPSGSRANPYKGSFLTVDLEVVQ